MDEDTQQSLFALIGALAVIGGMGFLAWWLWKTPMTFGQYFALTGGWGCIVGAWKAFQKWREG